MTDVIMSVVRNETDLVQLVKKRMPSNAKNVEAAERACLAMQI